MGAVPYGTVILSRMPASRPPSQRLVHGQLRSSWRHGPPVKSQHRGDGQRGRPTVCSVATGIYRERCSAESSPPPPSHHSTLVGII
eukprot:187548-Hanusia_phi.AAC.1